MLGFTSLIGFCGQWWVVFCWGYQRLRKMELKICDRFGSCFLVELW
jgi:hypothetical protein